jgi:cyclopropane-fatty-acyl-phospholipid synthase
VEGGSAQFLDSRMVYSCAYFRSADIPLEEEQLAKLDYICRKLNVRPGERFLDVGCGWGGLLVHYAERYGAQATGCTVISCQAQYVRDLINSRGLRAKVSLREVDYRLGGHVRARGPASSGPLFQANVCFAPG